MLFKSPYPWFGGKSKVASLVWERFGEVRNFVDPFAGSMAMLLGRPDWFPGASWIETINDKDGFVANFWRALKANPEKVAHYADWPVNENDLHARHSWLTAKRESLAARLEGDPDFYSAKIAGWWVWGLTCWIGGEFCSGKGPWVRKKINGDWQLVHLDNGGGVNRQLVHLGDAGQGVNRRRVHLGNAGQGVKRQRVHLGDAGQENPGDGSCGLLAWMEALAERLKRVRVCCGDWQRVVTPSVTTKHGLTAVFLDPPYSDVNRDPNIYTSESTTVAKEVRQWALDNGSNPDLRIALCGYEGEHKMPREWKCVAWKAKGGMANQGNGNGKANRDRERIWFSPNCVSLKHALLA